MKRFVICLLALVICATTCMVMAQDVVYLKNGSVIKGSLIEMIPNQSIKVQTADGSLFVYQMSEVDRIERDTNAKSKQSIDEDDFEGDYLERGFRGLIDLGAHFGFDNAEDIYQISAAFTGGYQINRMLFVGAGVAPTLNLWEEYDDEVETEFWLPIYSAIRLDFINKKVTPFIDGRIGYFLNTEDMDYSGLYVYAGAGVRLKKISLSTGYSLYSLDDESASFATLRFGFEF